MSVKLTISESYFKNSPKGKSESTIKDKKMPDRNSQVIPKHFRNIEYKNLLLGSNHFLHPQILLHQHKALLYGQTGKQLFPKLIQLQWPKPQ